VHFCGEETIGHSDKRNTFASNHDVGASWTEKTLEALVALVAVKHVEKAASAKTNDRRVYHANGSR
jgi:hypothetical protein